MHNEGGSSVSFEASLKASLKVGLMNCKVDQKRRSVAKGGGSMLENDTVDSKFIGMFRL